MKKQAIRWGLLAWAAVVTVGGAWAAPPPFESVSLSPTHDTWATHDDDTVHGAESRLKVGIEPQGCQSNPEYDPCPDNDQECCVIADGYNYCADPGQCATTDPKWTNFRKFRGYLRFDVSTIPTTGKIIEATLSLRPVTIVENQGGGFFLEAHRLKKIGFDPSICEWDEATLNDTNGTTWSSLPQNTSEAPDGVWQFNVTKAVLDWLVGDTDVAGQPIAPNCGFVIHDSEFGREDKPIERWVEFKSKEGDAAPQLIVKLANDVDGDGWTADVDCDEFDLLIHPEQIEECDNVDNDCDGQTDEENCDGLDNDCDGYIDEGTGLCGDGQVCIDHVCQPSCQDECTGPSDLSCFLNDETDQWERWGCGEADDDPCRDRFFHKICPENCNWGYCSSNCLDDDGCDEAGVTGCVDMNPGVTAVVTCGEYDGDDCLDWGDHNVCPKGTTCEEGVCVGEACNNPCTLGERTCELQPGGGFRVMACWAWGGGPCLSWQATETCGDGVGCIDGGCAVVATCVDACTLVGEAACDADAEAFMTCDDYDGDGCLDWSDPVACEDGETCVDGVCVGEPDGEPEPAPDGPVEPGPEPPPEGSAEGTAEGIVPDHDADAGGGQDAAESMIDAAETPGPDVAEVAEVATEDTMPPDPGSDPGHDPGQDPDLAPDPGPDPDLAPDPGPGEGDGDAGGAGEATAEPAMDAGGGGGGGDSDDCGGCGATPGPTAGAWALLLLGAALWRRRRHDVVA